MRSRGQILAFAVPAVLAAVAAALFFIRGTAVETSVYSMLGENASAIPEDVRDESSRTVCVVFSSESASLSKAAADRFRKNLPESISWLVDNGVAGNGLNAFLKRADGLVAQSDYAALSSAEGRARIARAAVRRYAASPLPPPFPPEEDPFCLKERFLASFGDSPDSVVALPLRAEAVNGTEALLELKNAIDGAVAAAQRESGPSVRIMPCGVPLHTLHASSKCRREVGFLSLFSAVVIVIVAFAAFRPVSRVFYVAANLAASSAAGAAALFAFFPSFHAMTAVFGTAVLGLVADYSFHWLLRAPGGARKTVANLAVSFTTTALALAPLAMSSLPVLRESAVFLAAARAAAFAFVVLTHPEPVPSGADAPAPSPSAKCGGAISRVVPAAIVAALCAVAAFVSPRFVVKTDPSSLYSPPRDLLEPEKILASKWAPPPAEVSQDVQRLYEEQGVNVAEALGLGRAPVPPSPRESGAAALSAALDRLTDETARRLSFALLAMLLVLAAVFRFRAVAVAAPSALAFLVAAGAVTLSGHGINLFHLLAGFLLAGMCMDYAVFLQSGERGAMKSVTCSFLTSMAGFGALAFVSFHPVAAFGTVLGSGLPVGYLASVALRKRPCVEKRVSVEKAASPLGMEVIWVFYRVSGLGVMRFLSCAVADVAWLFSPGVRKACPSRRKVSMFARSLADKVAVVSGRGRQPVVRGDGSDDAAEFAADVMSGRGVFVLSSHCGTVEALLAFAEKSPTFHAWTDMERTSAFSAFYMRHAVSGRIALHSIASIGMGTAFEAINWLERGECLVMAGDRGVGAFRFAAALAHPVYFATCIAEGSGYVAVVRRLKGNAKEMKEGFFAILGELEKQHPEQVYEWN